VVYYSPKGSVREMKICMLQIEDTSE